MDKKCPRFSLILRNGRALPTTLEVEKPLGAPFIPILLGHPAELDPQLLGLGAHEELTQKPSQPYEGECGRV